MPSESLPPPQEEISKSSPEDITLRSDEVWGGALGSTGNEVRARIAAGEARSLRKAEEARIWWDKNRDNLKVPSEHVKDKAASLARHFGDNPQKALEALKKEAADSPQIYEELSDILAMVGDGKATFTVLSEAYKRFPDSTVLQIHTKKAAEIFQKKFPRGEYAGMIYALGDTPAAVSEITRLLHIKNQPDQFPPAAEATKVAQVIAETNSRAASDLLFTEFIPEGYLKEAEAIGVSIAWADPAEGAVLSDRLYRTARILELLKPEDEYYVDSLLIKSLLSFQRSYIVDHLYEIGGQVAINCRAPNFDRFRDILHRRGDIHGEVRLAMAEVDKEPVWVLETLRSVVNLGSKEYDDDLVSLAEALEAGSPGEALWVAEELEKRGRLDLAKKIRKINGIPMPSVPVTPIVVAPKTQPSPRPTARRGLRGVTPKTFKG